MEAFRWDACFVTGLEPVDRQHHRLVDVINRYGDLVVRGDPQEAEERERLIGELVDYARCHFDEEQRLMERSGLDPEFCRRHRDEHAGFLDEVERVRATAAADPERAPDALIRFLSHWLAFHILGSDQAMARQIAAVATGRSPAEARAATSIHADSATHILLESLNALFQQVSDRNRALHELNQTLEARVRERTAQLSEANARLEDMALTDALTGLPNRRHALRRLEIAWAESAAAPLACMMIDADGFKQINDAFGHEAGDAVLRHLAGELRLAIRTDDFVARLGGDEFFVVCPQTGLEGAMALAEALRAQVAGLSVKAGSGEWRGSVSIGVAVRSAAMGRFEALMRVADEGAYVAKRNGRNCVATVQAAGASTG